MHTNAALRSRWTAEATRNVNHALVNGVAIPEVFPRIDVGGVLHHDLRGLAVTEMLRAHSFALIDFSGCTVEGAGQFVDVSCSDCLFAGAVLDTNLGTRFVRCDFSTARCNVIRGRFEECNFRLANLTGALGRGIEFLKCNFDGANFRKANLYACRFELCLWQNNRFGGGSLAESRFIGARPDPTVLGNTVVDGVKYQEGIW